MKALLVTSQVTFVPENYSRFVNRALTSPHISGLLILKNRSLGIFFKGFLMWVSGKAPNLGWNLMKNTILSFFDSRVTEARKRHKTLYFSETINDPQLVPEFRNFDLIFNARTRFIFKKDVLDAPKLGCLNIHHGLLPDQRGVFCDLWAKFEGRPAGFSLHKMSPKIDDGEILRTQEVPVDPGESFIQHTWRSSEIEALVALEVLEEIARKNQIQGKANLKTPQTRYFKNPSSGDLKKFKSMDFVL